MSQQGELGSEHARVLALVPSTWRRTLEKILVETPARIELVEQRRSARGTCHCASDDLLFVIRMNKENNAFRFGLTLLHELAHVHAQVRYGKSIQPHGWEWKKCYSDLIYQYWFLFPTGMQRHVVQLAESPLYSTDAHVGLSRELALLENEPHALFASDLKLDELFCVHGNTQVYRCGRKLRKRIQCFGEDGKEYTVSLNARVKRIA